MFIFLLPLFVAGLFFFPFIIAAVSLDLFILFLAFMDYRLAVRTYNLSFSTSGSTFFSIGKKNTITLEIRNRSARPLDVEVKVDIPEFWETLREPGFTRLGAGEIKEQTLSYRPLRRGIFRLEHLHYRYPTVSGLLNIYGKHKIDLEIEVFPDVKEINQYVMMTRRNRLYEMGIHKNRFRGMGTNLECLRDYQKDDDFFSFHKTLGNFCCL